MSPWSSRPTDPTPTDRPTRDRTRRAGASADEDGCLTPAELWGHCGPAETTDGEVVHPEVAAILLCDPIITVLVVDLLGVPLDMGRKIRLANRDQRRALARRDGGCIFPGCDCPASWCDAHHVIWWEHHGPTDIWNLALLCRYHHGVTHRRGWTMTATGGDWFTWTTPSGDTLHSQRHRGRSPAVHADGRGGQLALADPHLDRRGAEVELLAEPALEVAQVGRRELLVGEQGERRRVGGALRGVEHPGAVRAGLGRLGRADDLVDLPGRHPPVVVLDRVGQRRQQPVHALAGEGADLEHRRLAEEVQPLADLVRRRRARCSASSSSHLLSSTTTGQPAASMRSARRWSWWVTPSVASITSRATSARSTACRARTNE